MPIVARELSLASKRPATYRVRTGTALLGAAIAVAIVFSSGLPSGHLGRQIFVTLSGLAFAYAILSGIWCTADSVSEEKREGTLGLLFLTNLRGYDVVLGKLVAKSLDALYGLVAVLPILAFPVLLGAVGGAEFWRMTLFLLNVLIYSMAVGLLVSTLGRQERAVMLTTMAVLLLVTFGFPVLWTGASGLVPSRWWDAIFLFPSPAYAFSKVADSGLRITGREYWLSMSTLAGLSVVALAIASLLLPRIFSEKAKAVRTHRLGGMLNRWRSGEREHQRCLDRERLDRQPFLWLLSRDRLPAVWLGLLVLATVAYAVWLPSALNPQRTPVTPLAVYGVLGLHLIYKLLVACEASRRLSQDKRSGALELLLSTPLTVSQIVRDQSERITRLYALPFLGLILVNTTLIANAPAHDKEVSFVLFGGMVIAAFDFHALRWMAMLTALREPRFVRAVFKAFAGVMFGPWVVLFLFLMFFAPRSNSNTAVLMFFFWWFVGAAIYDLALAGWAKAELAHRFRRFAASDPRPVRLLQLAPPLLEPPPAGAVPLQTSLRTPPGLGQTPGRLNASTADYREPTG